MPELLQTDLPLPLFRRGKVRDVYDLGDKLLLVSTDRISALDAVLPCGIPGKGNILTRLSAFWFRETAHLVPNHFIEVVNSLDTLRDYYHEELPDYLVGRSMLVAKAERIPVECIARGYLSGSAWAEYKETGEVGNIHMSLGLKESQALPEPIFTPTTKGDVEHDRPLNNQDINDLGIKDLFEELKEKSLLVYCYARDYARAKGIIIADTKFEFGFINGKLALIDELFTPDSSRFWDINQYKVGFPQPSFDKQPVRDWLSASGWDEKSAVPMPPPEVIEGTSKKYREAYSKLTGEIIED